MPRAIYPNQLLKVIDAAFPGAKIQQDDSTKRFAITSHQTAALSAVVRLADQIAPELLPSGQERYVEFQVEIAAANDSIQTAIASLAAGVQAQTSLYSIDRTDGVGPLNPVTYIRRAME